jgi:hypothetical protein
VSREGRPSRDRVGRRRAISDPFIGDQIEPGIRARDQEPEERLNISHLPAPALLRSLRTSAVFSTNRSAHTFAEPKVSCVQPVLGESLDGCERDDS